MARDEDYIRLIHTTRWLRLRKSVLTASPLCELCSGEGLVAAATEVHHVRPVEEAVSYADKERLMYDPSNLMALCHNCHVKVHTAMGRCGKEANKKRNKLQVKQINRKFFGEED